MTKTPHAAQQRSQAKDRGAALVEFAMVAFVLMGLIFFIIEMAFAVRARSALTNGIDDAARKGAVAGARPDADWLILNQIDGRGVTDAVQIEYVTVYSASSATEEPNAACLAGTPVDQTCNVYRPDSSGRFTTPVSSFDCGDTNLDGSWCPRTRATDLEPEEIAFLGVYIKAKYVPIIGTALVDTEFDLEASSLQAIEISGED